MVYSLLAAAIIVYPMWLIFSRAGFSPFWSLLVFIPLIGFPAAILMLAFGDWPTATSTATGAPSTGGSTE